MARILIVGCGDIGSALGERLALEGHHVTGLKRRPPAAGHRFGYMAADITRAATLLTLEPDFDQLFFIVSADGRNEQSYRDVYQTGLTHVLDRFSGMPWVFVSSTSVYGQTQGEWVDEESKAEPLTVSSQLIREAEKKVLAANPDNTVVRFSGIYGPGREYLVRLASSSPAVQKSPSYYTNRIHQEDCVGALAFLFAQRLAGVRLDRCYLASDDDPAPMWDVVCYLAERLDCSMPTEKTLDADATMNKRCNNARLKTLGYRFRYPGYQAGYAWLTKAP